MNTYRNFMRLAVLGFALTVMILPHARGQESYSISLAQAQRTLFDLNQRTVEAAARYHLLLVEVERLTVTVEDMTP